jgi:hypothetical protein
MPQEVEQLISPPWDMDAKYFSPIAASGNTAEKVDLTGTSY